MNKKFSFTTPQDKATIREAVYFGTIILCETCKAPVTQKYISRSRPAPGGGILCASCDRLMHYKSVFTGKMIGIMVLATTEQHPKMDRYGRTFQFKLRLYKQAGWEILLHGVNPQQPWWRWGDWGTKPLSTKQLELINLDMSTILRVDNLAFHLPFPNLLEKYLKSGEFRRWEDVRNTVEGGDLIEDSEDPTSQTEQLVVK